MKRLKEKWKITSNVQFVIILVVFAITGSLSAKIAKPFCAYIGLDFSELNPVLSNFINYYRKPFWAVQIFLGI